MIRKLYREHLRNRLPNSVRSSVDKLYVRHILRDASENAPCFDVVLEKPLNAEFTQRALLSYITHPFRLGPDDARRLRFSNEGIALALVKTLNRMGFIVDVIDWQDRDFIPKSHYDLYIGHGGYSFQSVSSRMPPDCVLMFFTTTAYWRENNRKEAERFEWLERRTGARLPFDRWIEHSEDFALNTAHLVFGIGDTVTTSTYKGIAEVRLIPNASYPLDYHPLEHKDFNLARNRFLFFSGPGNVHKGLDLLLETFPSLDAELIICQMIREDFLEVYRTQLTSTRNISLVGHIAVRSSEFERLASQCAWVVSPSCAEGQPGAVVECMHYGLIPLVCSNVMNVLDFGIPLNCCSLEAIAQTIDTVRQHDPRDIEKMAHRSLYVARKCLSKTSFERNLENIFRECAACPSI